MIVKKGAIISQHMGQETLVGEIVNRRFLCSFVQEP